MKKLEKKVIQMRLELENYNDSTLPTVLLFFDEIQNEMVTLYKKVKSIPRDEKMTFMEYQTELLKADKSNMKYFLILYASLSFDNNNKRRVLTKVGIHNIISKISKEQIRYYDLHFESVIRKVYNYNVLSNDIKATYSELFKMLDYRIKGVHYSNRIWKNTHQLGENIYNTFIDGFNQGLSINKMAMLLSEKTNVGYASSVRLIKTEFTGVISLSLLDYYKKSGITHVQHISTLDNRTSEVCEERHLNIIPIDSAVVGENIPPLHPYCRSIIIPFNN